MTRNNNPLIGENVPFGAIFRQKIAFLKISNTGQNLNVNGFYFFRSTGSEA